MIKPGTILADRYEIVGALGAGGMGTVFEAIDRRFGNQVAVKRLDISGPAVERAFEREARLLRDLKHDGLPRVIDHFEQERSAYLVMDYVGGDDLSQALETRGCFPVTEVVDIARAVLGILEYLHGRTPPVLHRDVKPQNIKVHEGEVYLIDFGLAKGDASMREGAAGASSIAGYSPHYAPLEQIRGVGTDTWSDVYSLAATAYCLLTGKRPADALERATAAATGETDPLVPASALNPRVPEELSQLLIRAMSPNPTHRPRDARAMRSDLECALASEDGVTIVETGHADGLSSNRTVIEPVAGTAHERTLVAQPPTIPAAGRSYRLGRTAVWAACLLIVAAIGVPLWMGVRPWASKPAHASPLLVVGTALERNIAPGELHEYHVVARTGDAIAVALTRVEGRRFALSIADVAGGKLVEIRQSEGARLPVFWVARHEGTYVVSVRLSKDSGNGRYRVNLEGLRGASAGDLKLINAQASMLAVLDFWAESRKLNSARSKSRTFSRSGPAGEQFAPTEENTEREAQEKALRGAAVATCRESSEPALRVWALEYGSEPPVAFTAWSGTDDSASRTEIREIFRSLGDIQGEAAYLPLAEAARLCAREGYRTGEARGLLFGGLWRFHSEPGNVEAKGQVAEALEIFKSLEDWDNAAHAARCNAIVRKYDEFDERLPYLAQAIDYNRKSDDAEGTAYDLCIRGREFEKAGRIPEAIADLEDAVRIYRYAEYPASLIRTMRELAAILRKSGDRSRAEALLKESRTIDPVLGALSESELDDESLLERYIYKPSEPDPLRF